ncbi:MAG: type IV secretory system conjugative DNA transfer family protein [Bacilli bacterium]|nr:type IV secretory system conjugative DNA transfer family protein [Bacilli bacterium]
MKLRFRADAKDVIIFCIFAVVWLFVVAFAVANVSAFLNGESFTFNPFLGFLPQNLAATLICFVAGIVAAFVGVKSVFFEKEDERGIGLSIGQKKEKNYSRWAKDSEIEKGIDVKAVDPLSPKADAAGIPLKMTPKKVWVDNGGYHNLVIGSTGAGKTQTTVLPMVNLLAKHDESMIITDPKGEIYENTSNYLKSLGYNIVLLNFRDPQQGNAWNPMYLPYSLYKDGNIDKSVELLEDLAANILKDPSAKGQDPFWENTSADYFAGLACALFDDAKEEEINLNSISLMTTIGEEKLANTTYVKDYFSYKDPAGTAYTKASSTLMAPSETKGSILSVFKQKIQLFASRANLSEMLANNDFDMRDIGRKKTAVFIVIQDEKTTYHSLVTIFLKQCYETLISVAQESGGKLPHRTNFILDEFANMPPLKDVTTMVTAARSRNIRFTFIIQNFAQLYEVYGKENGETIKGNCGNIVYLISTELSALEEISKMCGEVKSKEKEKTSSTPLVTVSDLQRLSQWETIIIRLRTMPFKTKLTPNFKMNWGHNFPKATYPQREKNPVEIFDLKAFVNKKREEKINNMLNGDSPVGGESKSPFGGGGMPFNPFMDSGNAPKPSGGGGFNVDDLVKRIDAKIAELEEEERQEKAKLEAENESKVEPKIEESNIVSSENIIKNTQIKEEKTHKSGITDDQFFDDFFFDE